jgi:hypothetical protein
MILMSSNGNECHVLPAVLCNGNVMCVEVRPERREGLSGGGVVVV